jgi:4-oxalocrotonate tautomerase
MPFVNIRLVEGHSQQRKDEMARRIVEAISEVTGLPRDAVWVTFDDIKTGDWYIAEHSVASIRQRQSK